jgi:hypothetical protein
MPEETTFEYKLIPSLAGGLNTSVMPDAIGDEESTDLLNVFLDKRTVQSAVGYKTFGAVVRGYPQLAYQVFYTAGTDDLVLVTTATFYKWVNSAWQYVSDGNDTTVNGDQTNPVVNLLVASSAGFTAADYIGVTLDDGSQHQTTVASVPDGTHITMDDAIPVGRTAENGAAVVKAVDFTGDLDIPVAVRMWPADDVLIVSNGKENVKKFDGLTIEDLLNLPGGDCQARALEVYSSYLLLIFTTEAGTDYPQRVRWCDTGDITNWSTGNAGFRDLLDSEDFLVASEHLGPYTILYRERSIYRMSHVGTASTLFAFDLMVAGEGAISLYAIADAGDYHIVFGNSNLYEYNGGFTIEPVGDQIFYSVFAHDAVLNSQYRRRVFAAFVEELNKAWFFIPAGTSGTPNQMLEYDISEKSWSIREFYHDMLGYGYYSRTTNKKWSELTGSWEEQTWAWNERRLLVGSPTTLLCGHDPKQVYEVDYTDTDDAGNIISSRLVTRDFSAPSFSMRFDRIEFEAKGSAMSVYRSTDEGASWTLMKAVTLSPAMAKYKVSKQFVARKVRFKFEWTGGGVVLKWFAFRFMDESEH